jgi:hypothetical protein
MTNVRDLVQAEVALQKKAMIWTHKQLVEEKRVTIQQLASALRTGVAKAQEVMAFLIHGVDDTAKLGIKLQIFVVDGKLPDWLRKYLNPRQVAAVLITARKDTCTLIERDVHRKILNEVYADSFLDILSTAYRTAHDTLFASLVNEGLTDVVPTCHLDHLQQLNCPHWAWDRMTGRAGLSHSVKIDEVAKVHLHFGTYPARVLDAMDLSVSRKLKLSANLPDHTYSDEELALFKGKAEKIIDDMRCAGYGVVNVNRYMTFGQKASDIRTRIVFAENTDIGTTIAWITPWPAVAFK